MNTLLRHQMSASNRRFWSFYLSSVIAILLTTSLAKAAYLFSGSLAITKSDPVIPFLSNQSVLLSAIALELGAVITILSPSSTITKIAAVGYIASVFAIYKVSLALFGNDVPCSCLGALAKFLKLSDSANALLSNGILAYVAIPPLYKLLR